MAKRITAIGLALLLAFSPLSPLQFVPRVAPIATAQAADGNDLINCLNIANAAIGGAAEIAKAVADPEYTACIAEAGAGSVLTIGMMAAVTALWATDTSAFNNPGECKSFIASTLLGLVAKGVEALLDSSSVLKDLLHSILGDSGMNLIQQLAEYAGIDFDKEIANAKDQAAKEAMEKAKELYKSLTDTFSDVAGPLMHSLDCGCAAAGTVAIIKNVGEEVVKSADSCLDVLKDPVAVLKAILDDPGGIAKAAVGAACDAVKEAVDVCGFASDVYDTLKKACDIPGVDYACEGVGQVGHAVYCVFFDCDDSKPYDPLAGANSRTCELGEFDSASEWFNGCKCPQPYGKVADAKYECGSLGYNTQTGTCTPSWTDGATCQICAPNEGTQKTSDGDSVCVKCALGKTSRNPDGSLTADGTCSADLVCASDQRLNVTSNTCLTCPVGKHFSPDGQSCWSDCPSPLVNDPTPGSDHACKCPASADGKAQMLMGANLDTCGVPSTLNCPWYAPYDPKTDSCSTYCTDPKSVAVQAGDGPLSCKVCGDGKIAINNECKYLNGTVAVAQCGADQYHDSNGACTDCPYGTQKGEGNTCVSVCGPGSAPKAQPSLPKGFTQNASAKASQPAAAAANMGAVTNAAKNVGSNSGMVMPRQSGTPMEPPTLAEKICVKCGENEQSVTMTSSDGGSSISQQVCMKCPEGQVSSPGGTCHKRHSFDVSIFTPAPQRPDRDADRRKSDRRAPPEKDKPRTSKTDPKDNPKIEGTPALPKGSDAQAPKPKLTCPPGQIMESGRCRVPQAKGAPSAPELDMPGFGGGSSLPGGAAPGGRRGGFSTPPPSSAPNPNSKPF